jgi:hypothetical protein
VDLKAVTAIAAYSSDSIISPKLAFGYLKKPEGDNRVTLARESDLIGREEALLPALEHNIKCAHSRIASDFSVIPEDLVRTHAFD